MAVEHKLQATQNHIGLQWKHLCLVRDELEDNELFISDNSFMCMQSGRSERKGCVFPVLLHFSLFSL